MQNPSTHVETMASFVSPVLSGSPASEEYSFHSPWSGSSRGNEEQDATPSGALHTTEKLSLAETLRRMTGIRSITSFVDPVDIGLVVSDTMDNYARR